MIEVTANSHYKKGSKLKPGTKCVLLEISATKTFVKIQPQGDGHDYILYENLTSTGRVYTLDEVAVLKERAKQ